jgi:monoamine oxidase
MSRSLYAPLHRTWGTRPSVAERRRKAQEGVRRLRDRYEIEGDEGCEPYSRRTRGRLPSLIVIGAGFAGLMTAYMLSKNFRVTVLEARSRVGGRVHSLIGRGSKRVVEAGGELIGYNHPTWLMLAREFDLGLLTLTSDDAIASLELEMPLEIDGTVLKPGQVKTIFDEMTAAFLAMSRQALRDVPDPHKPWTAKHALALDRKPLSHWIDGLSCSRLTKKAIYIQFENTNAAPADRQSFLGNLALVAGGALKDQPDAFFNVSETARCEKGNQELAKMLCREFAGAGGTVYLSHPVKKIVVTPHGVSVSVGQSPDITADYAVLATPPSAWPTMTIEPALPPAYHVSMGDALKYLSDVKSRFWLRKNLSASSSANTYGNTWDGTDNQTQVDGQDIAFSVFAGGEAAQNALDIYNRKGAAALHAHYGKAIGKVYRDYTKQLTRAPKLVAWPLEQWTGAGYSSFAPGEVCRAGPLLVEPYHERLYFAGEHTCPAFYGYMDGALQSGVAAAKALCDKVY